MIKCFIVDRLHFYNMCRINKDDRVAGVLKNYKEGKTYHNHRLRTYLRSHYPSYFNQYD